ncbi:hypothetical protein [Euryhalocaulis caribicus]|uniref:hypothetical protein n=1 Tax=Euryhalocaulis caribicus TaxID=1161401 RepID=UPI0003B6231F|nr:hypothetical protein [Euryhalocaulis caribicus]
MKVRKPRSFEDALTQVCAALTFQDAAAVIGKRNESYLRNACDPDHVQILPIHYALLLDAAYSAETGEPGPLLCTYQRLYEERAGGQKPCEDDPNMLAGDVSREGGEAVAALLNKSIPSREKLRELEELIDAAEKARRNIIAFDASGPREVKGAA